MSDGNAVTSTRRHIVNVLDPRAATRVATAKAPAPTLYLADRLIVRVDSDAEQAAQATGQPTVLQALDALGFDCGGADSDTGSALAGIQPLAGIAGGTTQPTPVGPANLVSVRLAPKGNAPAAPADAWTVMQQLLADNPHLAGSVSLDHVVRTCGSYWRGVGSTWRGSGSTWHGVGGGWDPIGGGWDPIGGGWDPIGGGWDPISSRVVAEYGLPGRGGRAPVSVALKDPSLSAAPLPRHPVVVMPDTGIGEHPWYDYAVESPVSTFDADGATPGSRRKIIRRAGLGLAKEADREIHLDPFTGQPGHLVGHGTFIAGIVRQGCPQATLFPVPVVDEIGAAAETDVLTALDELLKLHVEAQRQRAIQPDVSVPLPDGEGEDVRAYVLDVLSLSVGYYAEAIDDDDDTIDHDDDEDLQHLLASPLAELLREFGAHGVLVVAGVGNGATSNRFMPAALAPVSPKAPADPSTTPLPIVAVGALNPDGATVAMFSNGGRHVTTLRPGVSVVSTMPAFNAGGQASHVVPGERSRSTVDLDDYTQGFGVWTGTSFAAPLFAADYAAALATVDLTDTSTPAMLHRGWAAIEGLLAERKERP